MNKKKKVTIAVIAALLVIGITAIAFSRSSSDLSIGRKSGDSENINETTAKSGNNDKNSESETEKTEDGNKDGQKESTLKGSGEPTSKSAIYISPPLYNSPSMTEEDVSVEVPSRKIVQFPYNIPGSNLTIESIRSYDGVFIENGSDTPVTGIATLLLKNNGSTDYDLANIKLVGDGIEYNFQATGIGSGKEIAVQEIDAKPASAGPFYTVDSETSQETSFASDPDLSYKLNDDGGIDITNNSSSAKPVVRIYYKFYLPEYSAYIGGITYTSKIEDLAPGETKSISPSHFDPDSSEIIRIQSYSE